MTPAALRRVLGVWAAVMGVAHALPVAFIALSAAGPAAGTFAGRSMSLFYYAHFILLVAGGLGWLLARSAREKVFHGGPFIDFTVIVTGFILAASASGYLAGPFLIAAGLRLAGGRPFFDPPAKEQAP